MDVKDLERVWQKQVVTGRTAQAESVANSMKHEVAVARRRIRGGIVLVAFVLFTGWAISLTAHLTAIKPFTPIALVADAVNFLLFAAFFVRAFQSARVVRNEMEMMGGTLSESIAAALRTVELQIANARIAAVAIPTVIVINASLFIAKYLAGDIPGFGAAASVAFMMAFGSVIGAIIWHRQKKHLSPRRQELMEMLKTLGETDGHSTSDPA